MRSGFRLSGLIFIGFRVFRRGGEGEGRMGTEWGAKSMVRGQRIESRE